MKVADVLLIFAVTVLVFFVFWAGCNAQADDMDLGNVAVSIPGNEVVEEFEAAPEVEKAEENEESWFDSLKEKIVDFFKSINFNAIIDFFTLDSSR